MVFVNRSLAEFYCTHVCAWRWNFCFMRSCWDGASCVAWCVQTISTPSRAEFVSDIYIRQHPCRGFVVRPIPGIHGEVAIFNGSSRKLNGADCVLLVNLQDHYHVGPTMNTSLKQFSTQICSLALYRSLQKYPNVQILLRICEQINWPLLLHTFTWQWVLGFVKCCYEEVYRKHSVSHRKKGLEFFWFVGTWYVSHFFKICQSVWKQFVDRSISPRSWKWNISFV